MVRSTNALKTILVSAFLALPAIASAGNGSGQISDLHTESTVGLITVPNIANQPACGSQRRFAFDLSKRAGQQMYFRALAALQGGKPVSIEGTGACEVKGDSETVLFIAVP